MDRDKVWTFGGGPRQCIGKLLSTTLLRVSLWQQHYSCMCQLQFHNHKDLLKIDISELK